MPYVARRHRNPAPVCRLLFGKYLLNVDEMSLLRDIKIVHRKGKADSCDISFYNPHMVLGDRPIFRYGTYVYIVGGWDDETIRKGPFMITDHSYQFPENRDAVLTIKAYDKTVGAMHSQQKNVRHSDKYLKNILEDMARTYNLKLDLDLDDSDDVLFSDEYSLTQSGETDATLLQRIAEKVGYVWGIKGNNLYFRRPEVMSKRPLLLEYSIGKKTLKTFSPKVKAFGPGGKRKEAKKALSCQDFLDEGQEKALLLGQILSGQVKPTEDQLKDLAPELAKAAQFQGGASWDPGAAEQPTGVSAVIEKVKSAVSFGPVTETASGELSSNVTEGISSIPGLENVSAASDARARYPGGRTEIDTIKNTVTDFEGIDGLVGLVSQEVDGLKEKLYTPYEQLRSDAGGATPVNADAIKRRLKKSARKKITPVSATMTPTVPSWLWDVDLTVDVKGVGALCSGLYELTQVDLAYTREEGLTTLLTGKKRAVGKGKKRGKGKQRGKNEEVLASFPEDQNASWMEDDNPRNFSQGPEVEMESITLINTIKNTVTDTYRVKPNMSNPESVETTVSLPR